MLIWIFAGVIVIFSIIVILFTIYELIGLEYKFLMKDLKNHIPESFFLTFLLNDYGHAILPLNRHAFDVVKETYITPDTINTKLFDYLYKDKWKLNPVIQRLLIYYQSKELLGNHRVHPLFEIINRCNRNITNSPDIICSYLNKSRVSDEIRAKKWFMLVDSGDLTLNQMSNKLYIFLRSSEYSTNREIIRLLQYYQTKHLHQPPTIVKSTPQKIKEKTKETTPIDSSLCCVCIDKKPNIVFISCGHMACCTHCSTPLKKCPICRATIIKKQPVYVV